MRESIESFLELELITWANPMKFIIYLATFIYVYIHLIGQICKLFSELSAHEMRKGNSFFYYNEINKHKCRPMTF